MNLIVLSIIFWIPTSVSYAEPVALYEVKKTGIIFEDVGKAITYQRQWTIMTQYDIPQWNTTLDFVQMCERTLLTLCNCTANDSNCKHWAAEVRERTLKIKEKIAEIKIFTQCQHTRQKRGLIDGGGALVKFLFGTMDHEDSEQIYTRLNDLEASSKRSISIAKQQLTLLKANNEVLGKSLLNLTTSQNLLIEKTNKFYSVTVEKLKNASNDIKHLRIMAEINELTLFMVNE